MHITLDVDPTSGASSRLAASSASRVGSRRDSRKDNSTGWKLPPLASASAVLAAFDLDFVGDDGWITRHFTRWPSTNLESGWGASKVDTYGYCIGSFDMYRKPIERGARDMRQYTAIKHTQRWASSFSIHRINHTPKTYHLNKSVYVRSAFVVFSTF